MDRDRAGHGACRRRRPSSPPATPPAPSPGCRSSPRWPGAPRRRARSTARSCPASSRSSSVSSCSPSRAPRETAAASCGWSPGFVALIMGIILVSPFFLALLARWEAGRPSPSAWPLRDLSRYRARSGSALSAISRRHRDRGGHLRRRRGPLHQRLRLRRAEHGVEQLLNVYSPPPGGTPSLRPERSADGTGGAEHPGPGDRRARHRLRRRRDAPRRARPARRSASEPERGRGASGTDRSTWRRRRCCGPTASTPRRSRPDVDVLSSRPGWRARACS